MKMWTDYEMEGYFFVKNFKTHIGFWTLWKTGAWTYELETYSRKAIRFQAINKKEAAYQAQLILAGLGIIQGDLKRSKRPHKAPWEDYLDLGTYAHQKALTDKI